MAQLFNQTDIPSVTIANLTSGTANGAQTGFSVMDIYRQTGLANLISRLKGVINLDSTRPKTLFVQYTKDAGADFRIEWSADGTNWLTHGLGALGRNEVPVNTATSFVDVVPWTGTGAAAAAPLTSSGGGFVSSDAIGTAGVGAAGSITSTGSATAGFIKIPCPPPFIRINHTAGAATALVVKAYCM